VDGNVNFLSKIPLFQDLTLDEISTLDQYLGVMELSRGDIVFNEGEDGDFVCFVIDGELEVLKDSLGGERTQIVKLAAGQTIGEMALVDSLPRSATVRALTPASLTVLSRREFETLLGQDPQIGIKILTHLARTLSLSLRRTSNKLSDSLELNS
jgi:CRP-like cAMP-binding protein